MAVHTVTSGGYGLNRSRLFHVQIYDEKTIKRLFVGERFCLSEQ